MGERIGVSDDEWALIRPLLPSERGRGCRPAGDNRPYLEGMVWMARTGAQLRHLPDEYGKWNSVFRRYRRWVVTCVFEAMLETLASLATKYETEMGDIDQRYRDYLADWPIQMITKRWLQFRLATTDLMDKLVQRIEREERELYPLLDR